MICLSVVICFLIITGFQQQEQTISGKLGDIKHSILPPDEFEDINGKGWRLVNGDNINATDLFEYLSDRNKEAIFWKDPKRENKHELLPDLSNKFIRSMGDKDRMVGTEQKFSTALPDSIKAIIPDNTGHHSHQYTSVQTNHRRRCGGDCSTLSILTKTATEGGHTHPINIYGGAMETRPNNIVFYTYIKVER